MIRRSLGALCASILLIASAAPVAVQAGSPNRPQVDLPRSFREDKLAKPQRDRNVAERGKVALSLTGVHGRIRVFVRLSSPPATELAAAGPAAVLRQARLNQTQQAGVIARASRLDRNLAILGRTDRASNVVAMRIDASVGWPALH